MFLKKLNPTYILLTFLLTVTLVISGCKRDKLDFKQIDDLTFNPELEVPLINFKMTLADLIPTDTSNIAAQPDGSVKLRFQIDSLYSFTAEDFVNIGTQPPDSIPLVVLPTFDTIQEYQLDLGNGQELYTTNLKSGQLTLGLNSQSALSQDVAIEITIQNATLVGTPLSQIVTLPAGQTSTTANLDLTNAEVDFTNGGNDTNQLSFRIEMVQTSNGDLGEQLSFSFQAQQLTLASTTGYFGQDNLNLLTDTFSFDDESFGDFAEGLLLADPRVSFQIASSVAVPMEFDADLEGINEDGTSLALQTSPRELSAASSVTQPDTFSIEYNEQNSNVANFLANRPTIIRYSGNASLNPNGKTQNEIGEDSRMDVGLLVEAPLRLSADNLALTEEIAGIDFLSAEPAEVEEATFIFYLKNGFPFDLGLRAALLDTTGDSINGFALDNFLMAAPVDANGRVTQATTGENRITLTSDFVEDLGLTKKLRVRARLNTQNNGQVVELFTDYQLEMRLAIITKLKINPTK